MFGLFSWLKIGVAVIASASIVIGGMLAYDAWIDDPAIRRGERAAVLAEARARALALIEQRNEDNRQISDLDQAGLCAELGGRWVDLEKRCD